jgi:tetratricopeptide (TPR) repeat protein
MTPPWLSYRSLFAAALLLLCSTVAAGAPPSLERIEYWLKNYQELTPAADARAATAHAILAQLVQVAGRRPGVVPRLFIVAEDPWEIPLPIAIRDGWIILSKGVLEICFREPVWGRDRLAFVLAHELAHHLKDDLWHMRFFDALEAVQRQTPVAPAFVAELRRSTEATEHVLAREVQADQQGMIYATMAGFTPQAIVSTEQGVNFFSDWVRALDPRRLLGIASERVRPTPEERAEALQTTLRQIADQTAAFQAGLWFYYAGDYLQAIQAFDTFRAIFAGPEVHQNLAASHHQIALQAYRVWQPAAQTFPFHLPVAIDPLTRASQIALERTRGQTADPAGQFREHLEMAIRWYREALAQDATYTLAARNLSAALILRGVHTPKARPHPDFAEAIMLLSRALESSPQAADLLNTLGVVLFYDERLDSAKAAFTQATLHDPAYAEPVYNLGVLARSTRREVEAQRAQQADARRITRLVSAPASAPLTPRQPAERVAGVSPGVPTQDVPMGWGAPVHSTVQISGKPFTVATYATGIMTLAQQGEIIMLMVREGYRGTSAQGIVLGSPAHDVLTRYGPPTRRHELSRGQSWAYDAPRIAFQFRDGQVVSWLRF